MASSPAPLHDISQGWAFHVQVRRGPPPPPYEPPSPCLLSPLWPSFPPSPVVPRPVSDQAVELTVQ